MIPLPFWIFLAAVPTQVQADWSSLWMKTSWLDIVFLCTFVFGVFLGLRRGLAQIFPGFFQVIVAQTVALEYSQTVTDFFHVGLQAVPAEALLMISFAVLTVGSIVVIHFLFQLVALVAHVEFKPPLNNIGAALLSGLTFLLFLGLICYFLDLFKIPFLLEAFTSKSVSGPYLLSSNQLIHDFFIRLLPSAWRAVG